MAELVGFGFFIAPAHVDLLALSVPRLDEHHVVLSNLDSFPYPSGNTSGPPDAVGTVDTNTIGPEYAYHDGEHSVVVRHSEVSTALVLVVAHTRVFNVGMVKSADVRPVGSVRWNDVLKAVPKRRRGILDKPGTKGIAGVASLLLGIDIVASQVPVVVAGLAFVITEPGLVAGGLVEGVMKIFGMA